MTNVRLPVESFAPIILQVVLSSCCDAHVQRSLIKMDQLEVKLVRGLALLAKQMWCINTLLIHPVSSFFSCTYSLAKLGWVFDIREPPYC